LHAGVAANKQQLAIVVHRFDDVAKKLFGCCAFWRAFGNRNFLILRFGAAGRTAAD
jgi:hypothetical protein